MAKHTYDDLDLWHDSRLSRNTVRRRNDDGRFATRDPKDVRTVCSYEYNTQHYGLRRLPLSLVSMTRRVALGSCCWTCPPAAETFFSNRRANGRETRWTTSSSEERTKIERKRNDRTTEPPTRLPLFRLLVAVHDDFDANAGERKPR